MPLPSLRCEEHRDRPGIEGSNANLDPRSLRVALSGDTALVGAPTKTAGSLGQTGAAYVFVRSGTTWTQQAELTAADATLGDQFGCSVALSGDTALIGARYKSDGAKTQVGAAYVFVRSGTTWTQQAELTVSDAAARDRLGSAVALEDDTAVIGAPGRHGFIGASYIFGRRAQLAH